MFDVTRNNFRALIGDLIVVFCSCTHFIFRKSHERTAPNAEQKLFTESKAELGAFFTHKRNTRVNYGLGPSATLRFVKKFSSCLPIKEAGFAFGFTIRRYETFTFTFIEYHQISHLILTGLFGVRSP